jgi:hypothetical protein
MTTLEITHIKKPERYSPVDSIQEVAGPWGVDTLANAVAWAEITGNRFIVRGLMGAEVSVRVMSPKSSYGNKYLQTVADRTETNNLLSLPEITQAMRARG